MYDVRTHSEDQRMYASSYGRFNSPDRSKRSARLKLPGSWNRYTYVLSDPINHTDTSGLEEDLGDAGGCWWDDENEILNCSATGTADGGNDGGDTCDDGSCAGPDPGPSKPPRRKKKKKGTAPPPTGTFTIPSSVAAGIDKAVKLQSIFTDSELDCISGIETGRTWDPTITSSSGRVGLYQFNQASWQYSGTSIAWDGGTAAQDPYTASVVALALLTRDLGYSGVANPTTQAVQTAIDKFGENDGQYGAAAIKCSQALDSNNPTAALAALVNYATWKSNQ